MERHKVSENQKNQIFIGLILLLTSRNEIEQQVIKLVEDGKITREIAKEVHVS
jgi:DNA-binding NarL/FixJ family response regulator